MNKKIGVFATEISSRIQGNIYKQLNIGAQRYGYNLVIFSASYNKGDNRTTASVAEHLFATADKMDMSAYIIYSQSIGDIDLIKKLISMGQRKNIPVFVFDSDSMGISCGEGVLGIDPDYKQGFAQAVRHVIEHHNCKRIYMLAGTKDNKYSDDRIEVFRQEMTSHGLECSEDQIGYGDFWEIPASRVINELLDSGKELPEAICCANDSMAIAAIRTLNQRGYNVPEDVIITGFDGIEDGKRNIPRIATTEPKLETISEHIFNYLLGKQTDPQFYIPMQFYPQESCGCDQGYVDDDKREINQMVDYFRVGGWQHHMIVTMQFELMNSTSVDDVYGYLYGLLGNFPDYSHLICIRDDIEDITDYSTLIDSFQVKLNKGFLPEGDYKSFKASDIVPCYEQIFEAAEPGEMFFVKLIHNMDNIYGFYAVKSSSLSSNDLRFMGQLSESATLVIESILRNHRLELANKKLNEMYEKMSDIYIKDALTGLYNRHGYYKSLDEYLADSEIKEGYIHLISIDMDKMKYINDNFGHLEGDVAIKAVADAIRNCFAPPCVYARFGGDEFLVALFSPDEEMTSLEEISERLNDTLEKTVELADKKYRVGVSVGKASAKISELKDFKELEKLADECMYENKKMRKREI